MYFANSTTVTNILGLPRDAMQSAVTPRQVVYLFLWLSVCDNEVGYVDHIGWNTSKIVSLLILIFLMIAIEFSMNKVD